MKKFLFVLGILFLTAIVWNFIKVRYYTHQLVTNQPVLQSVIKTSGRVDQEDAFHIVLINRQTGKVELDTQSQVKGAYQINTDVEPGYYYLRINLGSNHIQVTSVSGFKVISSIDVPSPAIWTLVKFEKGSRFIINLVRQ